MGHILRSMLITSFVFVVIIAGCEEQPKATETEPQKVNNIDTKANETLKSMCETLTQARQFEFKVMQIYDTPLESGQLVQIHCRSQVSVSRPDKLSATSKSDRGHLMSWHDGKTLTIFAPENKTFAKAEVPESNTDMLDEMAEKYDLVMPMADLIFPDIYDVLIKNVQSGQYIGKTIVGRTLCHHLAFRQDDIDWQIWISADEKPLPIKFVITYKNEPGRPRHMTIMRKWNLSPKFTDKTFVPDIPKDTKQITMDEMFLIEKGGEK